MGAVETECKMKYMLTELQIKIYELYKGGLTQAQIGQRLGKHQSDVSKILRRITKIIGVEKVKIYDKTGRFRHYEVK